MTLKSDDQRADVEEQLGTSMTEKVELDPVALKEYANYVNDDQESSGTDKDCLGYASRFIGSPTAQHDREWPSSPGRSKISFRDREQDQD